MGIKGLFKYINKNELLNEIKCDDLKNKRVGVDMSMLLYQVIISIRTTGHDIVNNSGNMISHIIGIFNKTLLMMERGIIPIFVFDGKTPKIKKNLIQQRKMHKQQAIEKLMESKSEEERIKYFKRCVNITPQQMDECRELLRHMGVPYIDAEEEADTVLAHLLKTNQVDYVLTEDMDILSFGGSTIGLNLTSKIKTPMTIKLEDVLNNIGLTYEQFVEVCILFGTDYNMGYYMISTDDIIKEYKKTYSMEKTIEELDKISTRKIDLSEWKTIKEYFISYNVKKMKPYRITLREPSDKELLELLVKKYGLMKSKISKKVNNLLNLFYKK